MDSISEHIELTGHQVPTGLSFAEFTGYVDRCVSALVAGPQSPLNPSSTSEAARLRAWLVAESNALNDGTPIDFALFDATILSVEERVAVAGGTERTQLLSAARHLAEILHAHAPTSRFAAKT